MNIVELMRGHLPGILEIEREIFTDAWTENMFTGLLESPFAQGFVAEACGEITGFILFYNIAPEIQILNLGVRKSAQKMGIGSRLLECAIGCEGIDLVTLEVRESNAAAINLYKKYGFRIDGVRKNYYEKPRENAVLMSLDRGLGR